MQQIVDLPPDYRPSEDEEYMNSYQLEYFRRQLLEWRDQLLHGSDETRERMKNNQDRESDIVDQGAIEADQAFDLRSQDRARKLLKKIDHALEKIAEGNYGYCEETEEPIGLKRLEARPIATLCTEAQEERERIQRLQEGH